MSLRGNKLCDSQQVATRGLTASVSLITHRSDEVPLVNEGLSLGGES